MNVYMIFSLTLFFKDENGRYYSYNTHAYGTDYIETMHEIWCMYRTSFMRLKTLDRLVRIDFKGISTFNVSVKGELKNVCI